MNREDQKTLAINFREELKTFTTDVHELHQNSGLTSKREFLEKIAGDVNQLYASSIKVQKEISVEIEEIGSIIQNIFIQPLSISRHHRVTLLKAVEAFSQEKGEEGDLSHIMMEYVKHPESTKSFLRELELLTEDLDEILRNIA